MVPSETPDKDEKKKKRAKSNDDLSKKLGVEDGGTDPRVLNTKTARDEIKAAAKAAGITVNRTNTIVRGFVKEAGVEDFDHLPVSVRTTILRGIESGAIT
jgi:hypothetical protein